MKRLSQALLFVLIFALLFVSSSPALAVRHRRPYDGGYRITAGYDNNGSASGCRDYGCGTRCYNTHTGTDYGLPFNTPIRASASGVVVARNDGCGNVGYYGNTCGGRCGNYVKLRHSDGTHTIYCHMKLGGLSVSNGQQVGCGQLLGYSASSGSSTGNHLHHGWQPGGSQEPYVGSCGRRGSYVWTQQNSYSSLPGTECENNCACSPGASERRGCGRCGSQTRTCGSNCQWGGWSGCSGEGPCQAGESQSEPCCDCGTRSRLCNNSCQWGQWGGCGGPDPSPRQACNTNKPGVCADGSKRCIDGCLTCVEDTPPSDELCDGLDNDCDGEVDDGAPKELGERVPDYAAGVTEFALPGAMRAGERVSAWVRVQNVGQEAWLPEQVVLRAMADDPNVIAALGTPSWLAYDIPARLDHEVAPGEIATFQFDVTGAAEDFAGDQIRFTVSVLGQGPVMCPNPDVSLALTPLYLSGPSSPEPDGDGGFAPTPAQAPDDSAATSSADVGCGCSQSSAPQSGTTILLLGIMLGGLARRRRAR